MVSEKKVRVSYKIKPFKYFKNHYWVGFLPYIVENGEPRHLAGVGNPTAVDRLKKHLNENQTNS